MGGEDEERDSLVVCILVNDPCHHVNVLLRNTPTTWRRRLTYLHVACKFRFLFFCASLQSSSLRHCKNLRNKRIECFRRWLTALREPK